MKLKECKQCKYHYRADYDDILCRYTGMVDYRVVAMNKKGEQTVIICPLEDVPMTKSELQMMQSI